MKRALLCCIVIIVCMFLSPVSAQETPAEPTPDPAQILQEAQDANQNTQDALNTMNTILSFIQVASVVLTIVVGVAATLATVVGIRTSRDLRTELREELNVAQQGFNDTRTELRQELDRARERVKDARDELDAVQKARDEVKDEIGKANQLLAEVTQTVGELKSLREQVERALGNNDTQLKDMRSQITMQLERVFDRANNTTRALALTQLAQQQFALGNLRSAAESLQSACEADPKNRVINYFLGEVYVRLGQLTPSMEHLRIAITGDYPLPAAKVSYAYALRLCGDAEQDATKREKYYSQAINIFLEVFESYPELVDISGESAFGALAGLYRRQGRLDKAIEFYRHAAKITPKNSYPVNNLALLSYIQGDRHSGQDYFKRVARIATEKLALLPSDYWVRFDLITAQAALEADIDQIKQNLEDALGLAAVTAPIEKLLYGLQELQRTPTPPARIEQIIARVQQEIDGRKAGQN